MSATTRFSADSVNAQSSSSSATGSATAQYLTFMVGSEMFAIGILSIKEIIEYEDVTVVPMMPPSIRGVINLRGAVVPVMDLSTRFGGTSSAITKRTCVVIVEVECEGESQDLGLLVDGVNAVLDIAASDIEAPPMFGARIRTEFIRGMGKINERFVIMLDVEHLLAAEDVGALAQFGNGARAATPSAAGAPSPAVTGA